MESDQGGVPHASGMRRIDAEASDNGLNLWRDGIKQCTDLGFALVGFAMLLADAAKKKDGLLLVEKTLRTFSAERSTESKSGASRMAAKLRELGWIRPLDEKNRQSPFVLTIPPIRTIPDGEGKPLPYSRAHQTKHLTTVVRP